jgi:hypothetical protein
MSLRALRSLFGESKAELRAGIYVLVCLALILAAGTRAPRLSLIAFCLSLGCTAFFALKRRLIFIGVIILAQCVSLALNGAEFILSDVSGSPEVPLPEVSVSVVPGGDLFHTRISPERCSEATVCFYRDGVAVVAAHSCGFSPGVLEPHTLLNDEPVEGVVNLIEDTQWGFAVSPLRPPVERQEMPLANAHEVLVGERATCLVPGSEPFDVEVAGWTMRLDQPYLVIKSPRRIAKGMSGSPVLQNGRIIGFLAATWPFTGRPPHIAFVSPAPAVYTELSDHLDK